MSSLAGQSGSLFDPANYSASIGIEVFRMGRGFTRHHDIDVAAPELGVSSADDQEFSYASRPLMIDLRGFRGQRVHLTGHSSLDTFDRE
jgi:hypothetical protein